VRRVRLQGEADSREPGSSAYPLIAVVDRKLAGILEFSWLVTSSTSNGRCYFIYFEW
jgi:hypothetical protein